MATALVVGAGFSIGAGLPPQAAILGKVCDHCPDTEDMWAGDFLKAKDDVIAFLNTVFFGRTNLSALDQDDRPRLSSLSLEDVYTLLDTAILRREWLPRHNWEDSVRVRRSLDQCVLHYLIHKENALVLEPYVAAAKQLTRKLGSQWFTVSLNWDTVWDNALARVSESGAVDYGYRFLDSNGVEPLNDATAPRLYKLHGSANWGYCPRCRSVFRGAFSVSSSVFGLSPCPQCLRDYMPPLRPVLQPLFLTPTLIKSSDNPYLNVVWDSALRAIADADTVVFLGYSFPLADHDLRYMLRKAVTGKCDIHVVLLGQDDPHGIPSHLHGLTAWARYASFFHIPPGNFHYAGWKQYFADTLAD